MIKIKQRNQIEVDDWDELVSKTYGKIYSFQQQDGCQERGIVTIEVPNEEPDDFEETEIPFKVNGEEMGVSFETWLKTSPKDTEGKFTDN